MKAILMISRSSQLSAFSRRGVSFFEFVGCLGALVGGVVLGSMYLGVDVKAMALGVLERSQLLATEESGEDAQPTEPSEGGESEAPATDAAPDESAAPPTEVTDITPKSWKASINEAIQAQLPVELSKEEQRELTKAYWLTIDAALEKQRKLESDAQRSAGELQLYDLLTLRRLAHTQALEQLQSLDTRGVNESLVSYSARLKQWHEDGVALYGRAINLLTDASSSELSGPFAQSWQSAATQHRMEEKLLREKHTSLERFLKHWFEADLNEPTDVNGTQEAA